MRKLGILIIVCLSYLTPKVYGNVNDTDIQIIETEPQEWGWRLLLSEPMWNSKRYRWEVKFLIVPAAIKNEAGIIGTYLIAPNAFFIPLGPQEIERFTRIAIYPDGITPMIVNDRVFIVAHRISAKDTHFTEDKVIFLVKGRK